jgi:hypothetical protein
MISYTTTRLLRCTSYLRFHFFPSPPLPLRLMSWRLSEIACARSASEVISIASNISLDILSLSPPRTRACSQTRATTAARSRTRGTPRGTPTAGYPRTEFPPQTAATPARRSRGTRRCRRFSAAPRGACEIFHPCSTYASRPGIVPPRVPCVPRGSRRPPVRRSAG